MKRKSIKDNKIKDLLSDQKGIALLTTLIFTFILVTFAVSLLAVTSNDIKLSALQRDSTKAFYIAESGIEKALWYLNTTSEGGKGFGWRGTFNEGNTAEYYDVTVETVQDETPISPEIIKISSTGVVKPVGVKNSRKRTIEVKAKKGVLPSDNLSYEYAVATETYMELKGNIGEITPCTMINLMKGDHEITVIFGDKSHTEEITIYPGETTSVYKDLLPRLKEIIVDPNFLYTNIGETRNFSTITAYYFDFDHIPVVIKLSDCGYAKDNSHAIINSGAGTFTGVSKGLTEVTIFYTEREFTKSDIVYISVGTFPTPSPEPEPDEILQASIVIVSWEQWYDIVTIYYEIENTGSIDIDSYEVWFTIECTDDSEYIDWDAGLDVKVDEKKMGLSIKGIEGKTAKSVSIRNLDLTNYDF